MLYSPRSEVHKTYNKNKELANRRLTNEDKQKYLFGFYVNNTNQIWMSYSCFLVLRNDITSFQAIPKCFVSTCGGTHRYLSGRRCGEKVLVLSK